MTSVSERDSAWILDPSQTVSDKIRALDNAGYRRADIARLLGKKYQHVRNVLEGDKTRGGAARPPSLAPPRPARGAGATGSVGSFRLVLGHDGALALPEPVRLALGLGAGDVLVGRLEGRDLKLTDSLTAARRARDLVRQVIPGEDSLALSLIEDRRREASREADD